MTSPIGTRRTDSEGAPVCGSRMGASRACAGFPDLLQRVINEDDAVAWTAIVEKID